MKILIIGFAKIKYMPYLNLYLDNIDANKNDVHILYWQRDNNSDKYLPGNLTQHIFKREMSDEIPKFQKIGFFAEFARTAGKLIKKEKFDFIIVLTSVPAVLLSGILLSKYKNRYIYDYRDYTLEKNSVYRKIVAKLVENSKATVYSSEKHLDFLPKSEKLYLAHNFVKASLEQKTEKTTVKNGNEPIKLSFWGLVRNEEFNRKIINKLANDERFEVVFHGRKQQTAINLENYCKENSIKNICFTGEYREEDKYKFAEETDVLYNMYSVSGTEGMAMGNKFYDGIIFKIPQICTKGSFMGEKAEEYGVGKALEPDSETFADDIYNYFVGIEGDAFKNNCEKTLKKIKQDNEKTAEMIRKICG